MRDVCLRVNFAWKKARDKPMLALTSHPGRRQGGHNDDTVVIVIITVIANYLYCYNYH